MATNDNGTFDFWNGTTSMDIDVTSTMSTITTTIIGKMVSGAPVSPVRYIPIAKQIVITLVYMVGVIGNISALVILFLRDKRRNRKHLLMLRCLVSNDLVALLGMLVQMHVSNYAGSAATNRVFCSLRVLWRLFGLFSGCVAIVMAAERWLALTRPFVYQKRVTFPVIVRCILSLWLAALTLTTLPLFGFGLYYRGGMCIRYREATEPTDIAYAYVWFLAGTLLCLSIVCCNLAVSRALGRLGRRAGHLRRISRASSRAKPLLAAASPPPDVVSTVEERAFAKLMAIFSISFVVCWMPQMISIPLQQYSMKLSDTATIARKCIRIFHMAADVLLSIHFTLDPYIYVLLRMPRPRFIFLKPLWRVCCPERSRASSFTGNTDHRGSSGDPPTPITEAPSTPVSEQHETNLTAVAV